MLLEEVQSYLEDQGEGRPKIGSLPTTPDDATALRGYGGEAPRHIKGQQEAIMEYPRFQFATRSKDYPTARRKAERVYQLLSGYSGVIEGVTYERIKALGPPMDLPPDEAGRIHFVCNFETTKELSPLA